MYVIECVLLNKNKPSDKERIDRIIPFLKSIFGYTDSEISKIITTYFRAPLAIDVTLEQVRLVLQPFYDNGMQDELFVMEYNDITLEKMGFLFKSKLGIIPQSPKEHYYDNPIIKTEQLVDPYNPPAFTKIKATNINTQSLTPTITCPYCQSTKCSRISILGRIVSVEFWGFASNKLGKQWHCHDCGSNF